MLKLVHDMFLLLIRKLISSLAITTNYSNFCCQPQKKKDGVQKKKKDGVQPQVGVEKYDNNKEVNLVLQECNNITSFTQLLTANLDNVF
jgi:hypothetical protein